MSLELATLLLFYLITPGYVILLGMRYGCRFDLKSGAHREPQRTIHLLLLSSLLIAALIPIFIYMGEIFYGYFDRGDFITAAKNSQFFYINVPYDYSFNYYLWGYFCFCYLITLGLAFSVGFGLIKAIESGLLKISIFHGATYSLIVGNKMPIIFCSVFTKVKHEEKILMYKGRLEEISYLSQNKIDYIGLKNVRRYLMVFENYSKVSGSEQVTSITKDNQGVSYFPEPNLHSKEVFFIDGEEISNILFSRVNLEFVST